MKLSTRARYALRLMLEIAKQSRDETPVSLSQVALKGGMPRRYLEQLVIGLKEADLLRGVSGKDGGYLLARPAARITLRAIVEAAIGSINIVDCVHEPRNCLKADLCECRLIYSLINQRITEVLDEFSLADVLKSRWRQRMSRQIQILPATDPARRRARSKTKTGAA